MAINKDEMLNQLQEMAKATTITDVSKDSSLTYLRIPAGGMYQEWNCLTDLVEEDTSKTLEQLANTKGWQEVQPDEAKEMGFGELVEWSVPETDMLVLIDDNFLVCLHKDDLKRN